MKCTERAIRLVTTLLENGADPNIVSSEGVSSLTRAVLLRSTELVDCLLAAGADPNWISRKCFYANECNASPVHACFQNRGMFCHNRKYLPPAPKSKVEVNTGTLHI